MSASMSYASNAPRTGRGARVAARRPSKPARAGRRRDLAIVARARCRALLTEATVVSSSSATSVACQRSTSQRISTARWRGGRCCSAATKASRIVSRSTAISAGSRRRHHASSGSARATARRAWRGPDDRFLRRAEIHRPGPPLPRLQHVEANVGRDAVQPRAQRRAALEAVERTPGAHVRVLHGVLGLERRAEHAVAVAGELAPILVELVESGGGG